MESERLARIEEKMDGMKDLFERYIFLQDQHNKTFFDAEKRVTILETTGRTAWKVLAILGTVSAALGATFAWVVEHPPAFLQSPPPQSALHFESSQDPARGSSSGSSSL